MKHRERLVSVGLFGLAAAAWSGSAYVLFTFYPTESAEALLAGAILLGAAIALTLAPVLWLTSFALSRRIAYRGAWWRAGRRAALAGLIVAMLVIMRGQGSFSLPLALFVVTMAVMVELTLSMRG